jgi:1,4-dihydroxy-2-naphthoate octaprenyltransferase
MKEKWLLWKKASRFRVLPVMVTPVAIGGISALAYEGVFRPWLFVLTLIGAMAAHLFSNMVNDLWDYRSGVDQAAKETAATISTNSGALTEGRIAEKLFAAVTWSLLAIGVISGILLSVWTGWWALILGGLGGLLAYFYVAPPVKYGYRGKGYSEIAIVLSFGVMPVLGAYYVQTSLLAWQPLLISLPVGLLTTLLLFNHHFLHWRADEQAGKRTLVVVWGEKRALQFSRLLCLFSYLILLICVLAGVLPWYALIGLVTAIPLIRVYRTLLEVNPSPAYLALMGASQKASARCGVVIALSLLIQAML